MADLSNISRRDFFQKLSPVKPPRPPLENPEKKDAEPSARQLLKSPSGKKVVWEKIPPERADLTAAQFPMAEITLNGGLAPYAGPWGAEQAAHLLRRVSFGVRKTHLEQFIALGNAQKAVDLVLNIPKTAPDPPVNNYNNPDFKDPVVPLGKTWINDKELDSDEGYRVESWRGWWLDLMVNSGPDIREKMTLFWHNHFSTKTQAVFIGHALHRHNALLRSNALGNFRTLARDVTIDACMLYFLNGFQNQVGAPDENYARELQELFTVGLESAETYTEKDVTEAARVLTGWRVQYDYSKVFFDQTDHDRGDKQFSAFYGNTVIKGGTDGKVELEALLDMIFRKEEVSLFLCRELYRFFVYYKIDAGVEENVIEPLAKILRDNKYEIRPVMAALLNSEHFFEAANKGCYIKTPLDLVVGTLRTFNLSIPGSSYYDQYLMLLYLNYFSNDLQLLLGDPPNVAGWPAFRQSPGFYRFWISGDTIRNRNIFTDVLAFYSFDAGKYKLKIDHIAFARQLKKPEDPNALIDELLRLLLPMPISAQKKTFLKNILLSGQNNDYYWTQAWEAHIADPNNAMAREQVWFRLAGLHKHIMNMPEYQLV
jgi:uncharacterized protein (DUF1800 family)